MSDTARSFSLHASWMRRNRGHDEPEHIALNDTGGDISSSSPSTSQSTCRRRSPRRSIYMSGSSAAGSDVANVASPNLLIADSSNFAEVEIGHLFCGEACDSPGEIGTADLLSSPLDMSPSSYLYPDVSLLNKLNLYTESGYDVSSFSSVQASEIKLLKILKPYPLKVYDQVIKWAHKSACSQVDFRVPPRKRQALLSDLEVRFNMKGSQPKPMSLFLPGCNQKVDLVVHDMKDLLYSLLTDPVVMRDENLLFHNDNPFDPPVHLDERCGDYVYADVNDGSAYYDAYQTHCKVNGRDVLSAVLAFVDKSHMDVTNSRLCMEPFAITLSIFKKEARTKPMFWRNLGYLVNQSHLSYTNKSPADKASDYHLMLEHILKSLVDVQNGPGIAWKLNYRGVAHDVVFKFPLMFVSGDTEGHDKLVGKYLSRATNVARLCRYCDCPTLETHNPHCVVTLTKAIDIQRLVRDSDTDGLQAISYHCIQNGFRSVRFCDPVYGINGATPAELLHTWQKGLFTRFLAGFFGQKRLKKVASTRKRLKYPKEDNSASIAKGKVVSEDVELDDNLDEIDDDPMEEKSGAEDDADLDSKEDEDNPELEFDVDREEEIEEEPGSDDDLDLHEDLSMSHQYTVPEESDLSRVGVFTESVKAEFDDLAKRYGRFLTHQSDRSFIRSFFPSGITSNCKKNGHEEHLVLLLCHIILVSSKGREFEDALDGSLRKHNSHGDNPDSAAHRAAQFIELISQLLYIENFIKQRSFSRVEILDFQEFVPEFLDKYATAVNRVDGAGMNFIKFHLPTHAANDMLRFGPPMSFDSSTGESNHKQIKGSARQTQRNTKTFEQQTAGRVVDNLLIERAYRQLCPPSSLVSDNSLPEQLVSAAPYLTGATYHVSDKGLFRNKKQSSSTKNPDQLLMGQITEFLTRHILPNLRKGARVQLFTQYKKSKKEKTIYRADPSYGSTNKAWHDWALIDWDWNLTKRRDIVKIPARLMIYFKISCPITKPIRLDYCVISQPGTYVILQSLVESLYAKEPQGSLLSERVQSMYGKLPNYLAHQSSSLIYWSCVEMGEDSHPLLRVCSVDSIHSPVVAVPYDLDKFESGIDQEQWLLIDPVMNWKDNFIREMDLVLTEKYEKIDASKKKVMKAKKAKKANT